MKFQHLFVAVVTAALLSDCSTPGELRQKVPALELKSQLDAKQVAACIADKWENGLSLLGTQPVNMKILKDGYSVTHGNEETVHLADIKDSLSGGSVTFYYKHRNSPYKGWDEAVTNCQN